MGIVDLLLLSTIIPSSSYRTHAGRHSHANEGQGGHHHDASHPSPTLVRGAACGRAVHEGQPIQQGRSMTDALLASMIQWQMIDGGGRGGVVNAGRLGGQVVAESPAGCAIVPAE